MRSSELHTFVFADLAGYAALTEAHGDEVAAQLAADFYEEARELASRHGAHFVKSIGDAALLAPHGASEAVCLGLHLAEEVGTRPGSPAVRVGMHTGPAVERRGDWFGAAVNLAARVGELAESRQVLLTEATRSAAGELAAVELEELGERRLRHLREPVLIHAARRSTASADRLAVDPVCRMVLDTQQAEATGYAADGRRVHFCSRDCAERFRARPRQVAGC